MIALSSIKHSWCILQTSMVWAACLWSLDELLVLLDSFIDFATFCRTRLPKRAPPHR